MPPKTSKAAAPSPPPKEPERFPEDDPGFFEKFAVAGGPGEEVFIPAAVVNDALTAAGIETPLDALSVFLDRARVKFNNRVDRARFGTFCKTLRGTHGRNSDGFAAMFTEMDTDDSGFLDADEFVLAMVSADPTCTKAAALAKLNEIDRNGDGKIDPKEFVAAMSERKAAKLAANRSRSPTVGGRGRSPSPKRDARRPSVNAGALKKMSKEELVQRRRDISAAAALLSTTEEGAKRTFFARWKFNTTKVVEIDFSELTKHDVDSEPEQGDAASVDSASACDYDFGKYTNFTPESIAGVLSVARMVELVRLCASAESLQAPLSVDVVQMEVRKRIAAEFYLAAENAKKAVDDEPLMLDDVLEIFANGTDKAGIEAAYSAVEVECAESDLLVKHIVEAYFERKKKLLWETAGVQKHSEPFANDGVTEPKNEDEEKSGDEEDEDEACSPVRVFSSDSTGTLADFLDFEFPMVPESTVEQRRGLQRLADTRPAIAMSDVMAECDIPEENDLITYIFKATGARVLSKNVFAEVISSLKVEPQSFTYGPHYIKQQASSDRHMVTLIPNLIIFFLLCGIVPAIASTSLTSLYAAWEAAVTDDWSTGCFDGPLNDFGCSFVQRSFTLTKSPTFDVQRFARSEIVNLLWGDDGEDALQGEVASSWLVGSLVMRLLPEQVAGPGSGKEDCISTIQTESLALDVGRTYGCGEYWQITIPFNTTKEDAIEMASKANLTTRNAAQSNSALIVDFFAHQRSKGFMTHVRMTVGLTRNGGVYPRYDITPIEPGTHWMALPVMILQLLSLVLTLATAAFYQTRGLFWLSFDLVRNTFLTMLCVLGYALLKYSSDAINGKPSAKMFDRITGSWVGTGTTLTNVDVLAQKYNVGMSVFGFYVMLFIVSMTRYLSEMPGLELITETLSRATIEILSLGLVLFVWTIGFICSAMALFGPVSSEFVNAAVSCITLLKYFLGEHNYDSLYASSPVVGPLFYLVFQLFVLFFALNLLIAVLTAPLESVKEAQDVDAGLTKEIGEVVVRQPGATRLTLLKWKLYSNVLLPLTKIFLNGRPVGSGYWISWHARTKKLYPSGDAACEPLKRLHACKELMDMSDGLDSSVRLWYRKSVLLQQTFKKDLVQGQSSLVLALTAIAAESNSTVMRDARLLNCIYQYGRWKQSVEELFDIQAEVRKEMDANTAPLAGKIDAAKQCAGETLSKLRDAGVLAQVVSGEIRVARSEAERLALKGPTVDVAPSKKNPKFHFETTLLGDLRRSRLGLIYSFLVLAFFCWFTYGFFHYEVEGANLIQSGIDGIANVNFLTKCADAQCADALSFTKTFGDVGNLGDLRDFTELALGPQLFFRQEYASLQSDADVQSVNATWFDPRVERVGPLRIRQLRGVKVNCQDLPLSPEDERDTNLLDHVNSVVKANPCFSHGTKHGLWGTIPPELPDDLSLSQPSDAYVALDPKNCTVTARMSDRFKGLFNDYPCGGGFQTAVNSSSELNNAMNYWIDNVTRFIHFSVRLRVVPGPGRDGAIPLSEVDFSLFVELGVQGYSAKVRAQGFPVSEPILFTNMKPQLIVYQVIIGVHLFAYIVMYAARALMVHKLGYDPDDVSFLNADVPYALLLANFVTWIIIYPGFKEIDRTSGLLTMCAIYINILMTKYVIAPAASFFSRPVMVLINTLAIAVANCFYVVPFLIIFYLAFAFGGMIVFGRGVEEFARFDRAMLQMVLGTFGDWDLEGLTRARGIEAQLFTLGFYCAVFIIVANLFLAMITSAAGDANSEIPQVKLAEALARYYGRAPLFGEWTATVLSLGASSAATKHAVKKQLAKAKGKLHAVSCRPLPLPAIMSTSGRLLFPTECLQSAIRPIEINNVLARLHFEDMAPWVQGAMVPFVIERLITFSTKDPVKFEQDIELNKKLGTEFATELSVTALIARAAEELNHADSPSTPVATEPVAAEASAEPAAVAPTHEAAQ